MGDQKLNRRDFTKLAANLMLGASLPRWRAPVVAGWFDSVLAEVLRSRANHDPLIIGPWATADRSLTHAGDVDFGASAALDEPAAVGTRGARLFVMGGGSGRKNAAGRLEHGGRWRSEPAWPIPEAQPTPFYLQRSGALSPTRAPEDFTWDEYVYDPRDPVPTIGGPGDGAFDQRRDGRPLSQRRDVLVFQTPPLERDVEVTGPVTANLWVASDCPDTDFTIKLIDVYPPNDDFPRGFAMNLTDGLLTLRHRVSRERPVLADAGRVYQVAISAAPTSNLFARGHRIRVDVSSSNAPRFAPNPNTGRARDNNARAATNRLHLDRTRASHVVLPLLMRTSA